MAAGCPESLGFINLHVGTLLDIYILLAPVGIDIGGVETNQHLDRVSYGSATPYTRSLVISIIKKSLFVHFSLLQAVETQSKRTTERNCVVQILPCYG